MIAAYLKSIDLSDFNPKAPPRQTDAFWQMVDANESADTVMISAVLEELGNPEVITLGLLSEAALTLGMTDLAEALDDKSKSKAIHKSIEELGHSKFRKPMNQKGLHRIVDKQVSVYIKQSIYSMKEREDRTSEFIKRIEADQPPTAHRRNGFMRPTYYDEMIERLLNSARTTRT